MPPAGGEVGEVGEGATSGAVAGGCARTQAVTTRSEAIAARETTFPSNEAFAAHETTALANLCRRVAPHSPPSDRTIIPISSLPSAIRIVPS